MSNIEIEAGAALASKERSELRARAHALKPVIWIAQAGATPAVLLEIERTLRVHELVKMHAAIDGKAAREALLSLVCRELKAHPVQVIGKMLVVYRARPEASEPQTVAKKSRRAVARPSARRVTAKRPLRAAPARRARR